MVPCLMISAAGALILLVLLTVFSLGKVYSTVAVAVMHARSMEL